MKALAEREVWFVTGSPHLYGADALRVVEDHARQIARALDESPAIPVRVASKPLATTPELIQELCMTATASPRKELRWNHVYQHLARGL